MSITGSLAVGAAAASAGASAALVAAGLIIVAVVGLVVLVWPRILQLDVDARARPVVGDRPYVEGAGSGAPLPEPS